MASSVRLLFERVASSHSIDSLVMEMAVRTCEVEGIDTAVDVAFLEQVPLPSLLGMFEGDKAREAAHLLHLAAIDVAPCKAEWAEHALRAPMVPTAPAVRVLPPCRPLKRRKIASASSTAVAPPILETLLVQDT